MVNNSTNIKNKKNNHYSLQNIEYTACIYIYIVMDMQ